MTKKEFKKIIREETHNRLVMEGIIDWLFNTAEKIAFRIIDSKRDALIKSIEDDPILKRKMKDVDLAKEKLATSLAKMYEKDPDVKKRLDNLRKKGVI